MPLGRVIEYGFFFVLLLASGFLVWQVLAPFITALILAAIVVTICYPLHDYILELVWRHNKTIAAFVSTLFVLVIVILPLIALVALLIRELAGFYQLIGGTNELTIEQSLAGLELFIQGYVPAFELNLSDQLRQGAEWLVGNLGSIFAGTINSVFIMIVALFGSFYFFRDGKKFLGILVKLSPLPDREDEIIFQRLTVAIRSVALGVLLVSLIQGASAAIGFTIFGIDRAILWGAVGALLSMIPGIGTIAIMVPGVLYLFVTGATMPAIGLLIWAITAVIVIDNIVAPQLMSRGNNLHPFIMLLSVLGGLAVFGPLGLILGPVIVTLFMVLLELYNQYIDTVVTHGNRARRTKRKTT